MPPVVEFQILLMLQCWYLYFLPNTSPDVSKIHEILTIAGYPVLNLATSYMVQCHAALHVCHTAILLQI